MKILNGYTAPFEISSENLCGYFKYMCAIFSHINPFWRAIKIAGMPFADELFLLLIWLYKNANEFVIILPLERAMHSESRKWMHRVQKHYINSGTFNRNYYAAYARKEVNIWKSLKCVIKKENTE